MPRLPGPYLRSAVLVLGALAALAACSTDDRYQPTREDEFVPPALAKELAELREANKRAGATFTIGFNSAALKPLEDLVGTVAPRDLAGRIMAQHPTGQ